MVLPVNIPTGKTDDIEINAVGVPGIECESLQCSVLANAKALC